MNNDLQKCLLNSKLYLFSNLLQEYCNKLECAKCEKEYLFDDIQIKKYCDICLGKCLDCGFYFKNHKKGCLKTCPFCKYNKGYHISNKCPYAGIHCLSCLANNKHHLCKFGVKGGWVGIFGLSLEKFNEKLYSKQFI